MIENKRRRSNKTPSLVVEIVLLSLFSLLLAGCSHQVINTLRETGTPTTEPISTIESLITNLKAEDPYLRFNAAFSLGELKDVRAVEPLIAALMDEDPTVRSYAAEALGKIGDARAIEPFLATLKDDDLDWSMYDQAIPEAFIKIGEPAVEPLITALGDENPLVRSVAAQALGGIQDARAVEPLIAALKDEDPNVPRKISYALEQIGAPAVEPLITALSNEDARIRGHAINILGQIKDARAVEPLIAVLKSGDGDEQLNAKWALASIGAPAVDSLIAFVKNEDPTHLSFSYAFQALQEIGAPAVEPLIVLLKDEDSIIRKHAAYWLGEIMDARAVEPLIVSLSDEDSSVRLVAAQALGVIKDARATEALIAALGDENYNVRSNAVIALGNIKDARAVEPLISALKDKDSLVRSGAEISLMEIGAPAVEPLMAALKAEDLEVVAGAYHFFIQRGEPGSETVLIKALNQYGTNQMAQAFLNCGNSALEQAGQEWAESKGYIIRSTPGVSSRGPTWGSSH